MMKLIKLAMILILAVVILLGTFNLASSVGIVPWFRISDIPALQDNPALAYNSSTNQFLVVWEDWRSEGIGTDIYAQIVNSDSSIAGGNFYLTLTADWQRSPKPAYNPVTNRYLVIWEDHNNDGKGDIFGQMVNANGTLSLGQFPIATAAEYQWNPDLAYNAVTNQFLVVWQDDRSGVEEDIYGQLVNADRTLTGGNFPISDPSITTRKELLPAVAYNSTNNHSLVVWEDYRNPASEADIYGRIVNGDGSFNGTDFAISTAGADQSYPDVAYASSVNRFLVVWEQNADIYGRLVNANKTFASADFRIASTTGVLSDPAVSYDPQSDQFMVVWSDSLGSDDIGARLVGVDGSMPDPIIDLASQGQGDLRNPAITTNTSNHTFMIAWQHQTCHNDFDDCEDDDIDIFGAFYQATTHFGIYLPVLLRDYQAPSPTTPPPTTPPPTPDPWVDIMTENFENGFPSGNWSVSGISSTGLGIYHWNDRTCRVFQGLYSGWALGGGADGGTLPCGSNYPDNARSWMIYGPFSLADATDAEFRFKIWVNTELYNPTLDWGDYVCRMASLDGTNFAGDCTSGDSDGWIDQVLDLSNVTDLGSVLGESNVWIALYFHSDGSENYVEGAYADDLLLRKCTTGNCAVSANISPSTYSPSLLSLSAVKSVSIDQP